MPPQCTGEIMNQKNKFKNADLANIDKIVNEYCSHMSGWAEYNPGTCQAGGPPPICPVNHWYKDVKKGKEQYDKKMADLLKQRTQEIKSATCSCWGNAIKQSFEKQNQYMLQFIAPRSSPTTNPPDDIKLPCRQAFGVEPCDKGYKCVNGFCVPVTTDLENALQNNTVSNNIDRLKDLIKDNILETIVSEFGVVASRIVKVYTHNITGLVIEALTPNPLLADADGYTIAVSNLNTSFSGYYKLLLELNRYYNDKSGVRDKSYITADLDRLKAEMTNNFYLLGQHYNYMKSSKEIYNCTDCCDQAFEELHRELGVYFSIFNSLKFE